MKKRKKKLLEKNIYLTAILKILIRYLISNSITELQNKLQKEK